MKGNYVVVGGGVAGVCCAEEICRLQPEAAVIIVTLSDVLKGVGSVLEITKHTEELELVERAARSVERANLKVTQACATGLDATSKRVLLSSGKSIEYDRLCICSGAQPKMVADSEHVIVLRDQDSVTDFASRLQSARRVVLVGNGGIALELVHAMQGIEVVWVMKQGHLGDAFFDLDAASFLLTELHDTNKVVDDGAKDPLALNSDASNSLSPPRSSPSSAGMPGLSSPQQSNGALEQHLRRESPMLTVHPGSSRALRSPFHAASRQPAPSASQAVPGGRQQDLGAKGSWPALAPSSGSSEGPPAPRGLQEERCQHGSSSAALERLQEAASSSEPSCFTIIQGRKNGTYGHAVGPKWTEAISMHAAGGGELLLERSCEYDRLVSPQEAERQGVFDGRQWPVYVRLTNGKVYGADLVISAIGVLPNTSWMEPGVALDPETSGIVVNRHMQSSAKDVWAAGDCCSVRWPDKSPHWFQMRLWSQARLMGLYAANCMAGNPEEAAFAFNFELFTHATRFLGQRVILLGLYNGQGLDDEPDSDIVTYSRTTEGPNATFVRVLLLRHRLMGAVLIGNTDYEEVFENLILDGLDLSSYGPDLLSSEVDLDQVFD